LMVGIRKEISGSTGRQGRIMFTEDRNNAVVCVDNVCHRSSVSTSWSRCDMSWFECKWNLRFCEAFARCSSDTLSSMRCKTSYYDFLAQNYIANFRSAMKTSFLKQRRPETGH
jgi:hypothetical protein